MAGDDEDKARAQLAEMQIRISEGPASTLGIFDSASEAEIRAAFLALTKQFHPARFARLAPDVARLATDVYLGIKDAHERMLRGVGSSAKASSRPAAPSGRMPVIPPEGTARTASAPRGTTPLPRQPIGGGPRSTTPPMGVPVASQSGHIPVQRSSAPSIPVASRTSTPIQGAQPVSRPTPMPPSMGSTQPIPRATTPPPGTGARPSTPPPTSANQSGGIPRQDTFNPPTVRGILPQTSPGTPPPNFDEAAAFREACALMEAKNWTGARQAFHSLAAKVPQSKQYRAWLCYTRGREAYLAGRPDDAIVEMQRALQLEPDLAHAKHALAELQRRR